MDIYLQHEIYKLAKHSSSTVSTELLEGGEDIPIWYTISYNKTN
jgi:hypothetical protein